MLALIPLSYKVWAKSQNLLIFPCEIHRRFQGGWAGKPTAWITPTVIPVKEGPSEPRLGRRP
jgi:hypothetical protein